MDTKFSPLSLALPLFLREHTHFLGMFLYLQLRARTRRWHVPTCGFMAQGLCRVQSCGTQAGHWGWGKARLWRVVQAALHPAPGSLPAGRGNMPIAKVGRSLLCY